MKDTDTSFLHPISPGDGAHRAVPGLAHRELVDMPNSGKQPSGAYRKNATGSETILLVEDDDAVRAVIRRVLEKHGYDVIEATNGMEALEVCAAHLESVHLVLSDVVMPRMSGRVLLDRLMELPSRPKVLMMSGYTEDEIGRHGAFPAGTPFIDKPFSITTVTRRIRDVLDGRA